MQKEMVSPETILKEAPSGSVKEASFVQRAGLFLAAGVGSAMFVVILGIGVFLLNTYPSITDIHADTASTNLIITVNSQSQPLSIEDYKLLSDISVTHANNLFETIVAKALLPLFTAILGYIFGRSDK